jgi:hypothetical protein
VGGGVGVGVGRGGIWAEMARDTIFSDSQNSNFEFEKAKISNSKKTLRDFTILDISKNYHFEFIK